MAHHARERRKYKRRGLTCPITVHDAKGRAMLRSRADNVSDGGVYLTLAVADLAKLGKAGLLGVRLSVPRSTNNTFMFEEFQSHAKVVRTEPLVNADRAGMALQLTKPWHLDLDA